MRILELKIGQSIRINSLWKMHFQWVTDTNGDKHISEIYIHFVVVVVHTLVYHLNYGVFIVICFISFCCEYGTRVEEWKKMVQKWMLPSFFFFYFRGTVPNLDNKDVIEK